VSLDGGDAHALSSGSNAPDRAGEIGAFVDQARWLIEVHTARGETGPATRRRRDRTLIWSGRVQVDA